MEFSPGAGDTSIVLRNSNNGDVGFTFLIFDLIWFLVSCTERIEVLVIVMCLLMFCPLGN
jgi:hypothetical protein